MTILTSHRPRGTDVNASDVFDSFNADVEELICRACCASCRGSRKKRPGAAVDGFVALSSRGVQRPQQQLPLRVSVSLRRAAKWQEIYFLPCSLRPFWPYSSAPQRHKWRHPVSCREGRKEGERRGNYNKGMEITDLELSDNRGSATSGQNDRDDG